MARGIIAWHNEMRNRAHLYSKGHCQACNKEIARGVIHHNQYPKGWKNFDVEYLMDVDVCVYLCQECHTLTHKNDALKPCDICGELTLHGLQRGKQLWIPDVSLCRNCSENLKREYGEILLKKGVAEIRRSLSSVEVEK